MCLNIRMCIKKTKKLLFLVMLFLPVKNQLCLVFIQPKTAELNLGTDNEVEICYDLIMMLYRNHRI